VVTLDNVSKTYAMTGGRKIVLRDATAAFLPGHNYGVLGINGAGKSTLIRLLAGSEMPDRGRVRRHARVSFPLGFGGTFHGALSGRENVAFIARIYGAAVRSTTRYVEEFAELDVRRGSILCHSSPAAPVIPRPRWNRRSSSNTSPAVPSWTSSTVRSICARCFRRPKRIGGRGCRDRHPSKHWCCIGGGR
jgi:energy-coupling factor transporter ATP-binding protein EcfA2